MEAIWRTPMAWEPILRLDWKFFIADMTTLPVEKGQVSETSKKDS